MPTWGGQWQVVVICKGAKSKAEGSWKYLPVLVSEYSWPSVIATRRRDVPHAKCRNRTGSVAQARLSVRESERKKRVRENSGKRRGEPSPAFKLQFKHLFRSVEFVSTTLESLKQAKGSDEIQGLNSMVRTILKRSWILPSRLEKSLGLGPLKVLDVSGLEKSLKFTTLSTTATFFCKTELFCQGKLGSSSVQEVEPVKFTVNVKTILCMNNILFLFLYYKIMLFLYLRYNCKWYQVILQSLVAESNIKKCDQYLYNGRSRKSRKWLYDVFKPQWGDQNGVKECRFIK